MKHNRPGIKHPLCESYNGPERSTKFQKHIGKQRVIDRKNNKYRETVWDFETGEIVHHCEEPLSQHLNHGSAKQRKTVMKKV
jgi:hypothetical protein